MLQFKTFNKTTTVIAKGIKTYILEFNIKQVLINLNKQAKQWCPGRNWYSSKKFTAQQLLSTEPHRHNHLNPLPEASSHLRRQTARCRYIYS